MKIKLIRTYKSDTYTIGNIYIDDKYFCDSLEDRVRDYNMDGDLLDAGESKVFGKTAIPYGTYEVILTMSPRFKRMLPRLVGVKHFDGVLIHRGNKAKDTHGCILVGENKQKGAVINSTKYELLIVDAIKSAMADGEKVTIEIV